MTLHPEVMKKAQTEIDAVVGNDRLPGFGDRKNLPYIDALVKEVLRWNSVTPTGKTTCFSNESLFLTTILSRHATSRHGR